MSGLEINKIVGAILLATLTLTAIGLIGNALIGGGGHEAPKSAASAPEKEPAPAKAAPMPAKTKPKAAVPSAVALVAAADVARGAKLFRKCAACHTTNKGDKNKLGPNLWNIVNGGLGQAAGFRYSAALTGKGGNWSYDSLDAFLTKPKAYIPGTKMAFAGLKKMRDRADLIAFLRSLSDSPAPLP